MNVDIPEENYLDTTFINLINNLEIENFSNILIYFIENYSSIYNEENFENFSRIISSEIKSEIPLKNIWRQIKYLINQGVYSRLSKAFLNNLLSLGFSEEKLNTLREIQKKNLDKIIQILNKDQVHIDSNIIKGKNRIIDVEIKTEMPSFTTNYNYMNEFDDNENEDIKKQNLHLNFVLDRNTSSENNIKNEEKFKKSETGNGNLLGLELFQNLSIKMNKNQLVSFYEQIEKIQESLDKLG